MPAATPQLDRAHATSGTIGNAAGSVSLTTADGTTFVLHVPQHATPFEPVTMTGVTALTPASAVGRLVTGVDIEPQDVAPLGTTLEIRRSSWPRGARAVMFGGSDPSGGAVPLPGRLDADTTIPVTGFGGYGVAVPAGAVASAARVPCSRAVAHAAAAGSRPLLSCIAIAEKWRSLADTGAKAGGDPGLLSAIYAAAAQAVAGEMAQVLSQPPSDAGAAELEVLLPYGIGLQRQVELGGFPAALLAPLDAQLVKAFDYQIKLIQSVCQGSGRHPSGVYLDYYRQTFAVERQRQLMGVPAPDFQALLAACIDKVRLELNGRVEATVDHQSGGGWTSHVVETVTATIKGDKAKGGLESDKAALKFDTAKATADPGFAAIGGTATMTSEAGKLEPDIVNAWVVRKVRCDKDRHFVVDRTVFLDINTLGLWDDHEQVQLAVNGNPAGQEPDAVAAIAWGQDYHSRGQRITMQLDKDTISKARSGNCDFAGECSTFSYSATLSGSELEN